VENHGPMEKPPCREETMGLPWLFHRGNRPGLMLRRNSAGPEPFFKGALMILASLESHGVLKGSPMISQ